jgi:hypothetical protein
MDPLTILAMANAAVAAVKKGCQLYKDVRGAVGNVKEVLDDLEKTFKAQHKDKPPSQEAVKQYNAERDRVKSAGSSDPNDIISEVGARLGDFFDAFDKIEQLFYDEERKAKQVYTGDESLSKRALQRVLIRSRLEMMYKDIREEMIYNTPGELKDLWTRFEKMRAQVQEEQEQARAKQAVLDAEKAWQRQQVIDRWRGRAGAIVAILLAAAYIWGLLWAINRHRTNLKDFLS